MSISLVFFRSRRQASKSKICTKPIFLLRITRRQVNCIVAHREHLECKNTQILNTGKLRTKSWPMLNQYSVKGTSFLLYTKCKQEQHHVINHVYLVCRNYATIFKGVLISTLMIDYKLMLCFYDLYNAVFELSEFE